MCGHPTWGSPLNSAHRGTNYLLWPPSLSPEGHRWDPPHPDCPPRSWLQPTHLYYQYLKTLGHSLHSSSPSVIQDSLFITHTPNHHCNIPHAAHVDRQTPHTNGQKTADLAAHIFKAGNGQPMGVQSEKQTLSQLSPFFQVGMNMSRRVRTRGPEKYCYLYPVFWQLCFHGQHLSSVHIRVVSLIEGLFQLLQLVGCEDCPERNKTLWPKNITRSKGDTESEKWTQMLQKPE